jgi:hypothetical protein
LSSGLELLHRRPGDSILAVREIVGAVVGANAEHPADVIAPQGVAPFHHLVVAEGTTHLAKMTAASATMIDATAIGLGAQMIETVR